MIVCRRVGKRRYLTDVVMSLLVSLFCGAPLSGLEVEMLGQLKRTVPLGETQSSSYKCGDCVLIVPLRAKTPVGVHHFSFRGVLDSDPDEA